MGEVENISPGLQRKLIVQLSEPGTYQTACKPGMVGDGIRGDFKVTGETVAGRRRRQVQGGRRQLQALRGQPDRRTRRGHQDSSSQPSRRAISPRPRRSSRSRAPTTSASSRWPSRSPTTSTRASTCARPTWSPARSGPASTGWRRICGSAACSPTPTRSPTSCWPTSRSWTTKVKAPDYTIDSTQIAGGAQGLLDEVAASKITGEEDIFSHTDLWDFQANVEGSQTAVASVRPILDERDAELGKNGSTSGSPMSTHCWTSTARATASCSTTR